MNCAKCGLDLPPGTKQCPKCGLFNEFAPEAPKKRKPLLWIVAALGLIIVASVVFAAVMASRSKPTITQAPGGNIPPGGITAAPPGSPAGGDIMSAPPGAPQNATTPPGVAKPKPPREVVEYLEHVKKVEEHRQVLLKDTGDALMLSAAGGQAAGLMKMIDMASDPDSNENVDPLKESKDELARQYKNWISALQYFDKKPAPNQCREFSGAYRDVLYKETGTIGQIAVSMSKVNIMDPKDMQQLLSTLQKMKGDPSIQRNIDTAADTADAKLTQLVSNYDMQKPFSVPREQQSGGSIMGF